MNGRGPDGRGSDGLGPDGTDSAGHGPVAGIDIGGTKIATLIVDAEGIVLGRATHASTVADQANAAAAIAACLDDALAGTGLGRDDLTAIGVGVPGRVDPERGHVTLAVNLGWTDFALRDELETALARPVVIENDARAAAIGLHERGIAGPSDDIAYLAVGTGIAAGVILGGRLHRGARGLAGEIGHAIADSTGPRCACGQHGCLEAFASGPSIARRARTTSAREVYESATAGDRDATALVDDVGRRLAWAVHTLVMAYDVERVVVGGGVSHAGEPFERPLRRELARLRAASDLAGELLPADIVHVLPPEAEPGAWGAVAIARTVTQGSEVVSHA
ncbi:MAG: ROK family protein [Candidatus Limnocylindrales bacterium]